MTDPGGGGARRQRLEAEAGEAATQRRRRTEQGLTARLHISNAGARQAAVAVALRTPPARNLRQRRDLRTSARGSAIRGVGFLRDVRKRESGEDGTEREKEDEAQEKAGSGRCSSEAATARLLLLLLGRQGHKAMGGVEFEAGVKGIEELLSCASWAPGGSRQR